MSKCSTYVYNIYLIFQLWVQNSQVYGIKIKILYALSYIHIRRAIRICGCTDDAHFSTIRILPNTFVTAERSRSRDRAGRKSRIPGRKKARKQDRKLCNPTPHIPPPLPPSWTHTRTRQSHRKIGVRGVTLKWGGGGGIIYHWPKQSTVYMWW